MRESRNIALSWLRKADNEADQFSRFATLWFGFNSLYNEFYYGDERRAIGDFVFSDDYHLHNFTIERILQAQSSRFFAEHVIRDVRGGTDTAEDQARMNGASFSAKRRLKALLIILYQVRCNLFHGHKVFGRHSDETVVSHAAEALHCILHAYLADSTTSTHGRTTRQS